MNETTQDDRAVDQVLTEIPHDPHVNTDPWPSSALDPFADPSLVRPIDDDAAATDGEVEAQSSRNAIAVGTPSIDPTQQARRVRYVFDLLGQDGEAKQEGVREFNKLADDFCGILSNKSPDNQAEITARVWNDVFSPVMVQADVVRVVCALICGRMANTIKASMAHGEWMPTAMKYFPGKSIKVLQENMRLASLRKVERHCHRGLTLLKKLNPIAENPPFSTEDDPLEAVFEYVQTKSEALECDYSVLAALAIGDLKLKKAGLVIPMPALRTFCEQKFELNAADIKEMQAMKKVGLDPVAHLESIGKNAGSRVFSLTNPGKKKGAGDQHKVPDINTTFVTTSQIITAAIKSGKVSANNVNRENYDALIAALVHFEKVAFPSRA